MRLDTAVQVEWLVVDVDVDMVVVVVSMVVEVVEVILVAKIKNK